MRTPGDSLESFLGDVGEILRQEVGELVRLGATYIQLDAPHYPLLVDPAYREFYESRGWSADRWIELGADLDNIVMAAHPGVVFGFHLGRGNQMSRWLVAGGYDWPRGPVVPARACGTVAPRVRRRAIGLLRRARRRPGGQDGRARPRDHEDREDRTVEELSARIEEASRFVPRERLALSPQCGFATSVCGNAVTVEQERAKLQAVAETAAAMWGDR